MAIANPPWRNPRGPQSRLDDISFSHDISFSYDISHDISFGPTEVRSDGRPDFTTGPKLPTGGEASATPGCEGPPSSCLRARGARARACLPLAARAGGAAFPARSPQKSSCLPGGNAIREVSLKSILHFRA